MDIDTRNGLNVHFLQFSRPLICRIAKKGIFLHCEIVSNNMSYCIFCGTKNRDEALFCKNCGKPLSEPESEENKVEQPVAQEPVAPKPVVPEPVVQKPAVQQPVAPEQREPSYSSAVNVSQPKNKTLITIIILIPVLLFMAAIVGGAIYLFCASKTIKEEMANTMEVINQETEASQDNETGKDDTVAVVENTSERNETAEATETLEASETTENSHATDVVAEKTTAEVATPPSRSLSTKAKPTIADFNGWYINGAMKRGKPSGVRALTDMSEISGSWKAIVYLDPTNRSGDKAQTFCTMTIDGTNDRIKIRLKTHYTHFFNGNEIMDESSEAPLSYSGRFNSGRLIASGVGSFTITDFWEQGGKQYAIGTLSPPDGVSSYVALVRP